MSAVLQAGEGRSGETEWIKWSAGPCPVDPGTFVDVKWNNGAVSRYARAGSYSANKYQQDLWESTDPKCHIVAYRLSSEPEPRPEQPARIWVKFSDDAENIRKWSREPFEGATEFNAA